MKYIIDGYNVIHKIELFKGRDLRGQREALISCIESAGVAHGRLKDVTVVFDGKSQIRAPAIKSAVKVVFSKGFSADKKIKEILRASTFARDMTVVSDDREVISYANSSGAKKLSVTEFESMLFAPRKKHSSFKLDDVSARDINRELKNIWLKE